MTRNLVTALPILLTALSTALAGQDPDYVVRRVNQPVYLAPDGSVSRLRLGNPSTTSRGPRVHSGPGRFTVGVVLSDGCIQPHSVEHSIEVDTITITLFVNAPATCAELMSLREYFVTVTGLKPHHYLLRLYIEGRGGRGGKASGAAPRLTADAYAL